MSLIQLADFAVFDTVDGEGIILDTSAGRYLGLNIIATVILEAAIQFETSNEVVRFLRHRIDANDEKIEQGIHNLKKQLTDFGVTKENSA